MTPVSLGDSTYIEKNLTELFLWEIQYLEQAQTMDWLD